MRVESDNSILILLKEREQVVMNYSSMTITKISRCLSLEIDRYEQNMKTNLKKGLRENIDGQTNI